MSVNNTVIALIFQLQNRRTPPSSATSVFNQSPFLGTSLVAQWLRIHLPMQGTQVRALAWEDPTCYGTRVPQLLSLHSRAHTP